METIIMYILLFVGFCLIVFFGAIAIITSSYNRAHNQEEIKAMLKRYTDPAEEYQKRKEKYGKSSNTTNTNTRKD